MRRVALALLVCLAIPHAALAAITFDTENVADGTSVSSLTLSYTCAAGATLLVNAARYTTGTLHDFSTVKYGGVDLSLFLTQSTGSNGVRVGQYLGYQFCDGSAHNIVVTMAGVVDRLSMNPQSWLGVGGFGDTQRATGASTTPSVTVTSATGEVVVDFVGAFNASALGATSVPDVGGNYLIGPGTHGNGSLKFCSYKKGGAASTNMAWNLDSSSDWAQLALALQPVVGGVFRSQGDLTGLGTGGKFRKDPTQYRPPQLLPGILVP